MAAVDIIIPLYNKERTVARAVESILNQTFHDWHLTIVDDGSTDNSVNVVRQFEDRRITLMQQDNRGPGGARNAGIQKTTAKYIAFLDADDEWDPWYLDNAVHAMQQSAVSFVGSLYEDRPRPENMPQYWAQHGVKPGCMQLNVDMSPRLALFHIFFFHVGNTIVLSEVVKRYGGFYDDEKCLLGEDTVFFARLAFNEPFCIIEPVAVCHHRRDSELSNVTERPLDIFLQKPHIILDYCTGDKKAFALKVLTWHAWSTAHFRARAGRKQEAIYLKEHFPDMKQLGFNYWRLCLEIRLSRWLPGWIKLKCKVSGPIKRLLKKA